MTDAVMLYQAEACQNCPIHRILAVLKEHAPPSRFVTLRDAISQCLDAKKSANLRKRYIDSLRQYLNQFARGREEMSLQSFGVQHLQLWFKSRHESNIARASNIGRLSALFAYGIKQGWILDNPCKRLERVIIDSKAPGIHTIEEVEKLLRTAQATCPALLGYLAPLYFGFLRPIESEKLCRADIHDQLIEITPAKAKTRRRRFVSINETLAAWLAVPGAKLGAEFTSITLRRRLRQLKNAAGVPWPHDCLRHSCCSYALPIFGALKTAEWAGHSEQILFAHYRARVRPDDAKAFWALRP